MGRKAYHVSQGADVSHLVIYDIDGIEQFERFAALDEATTSVERLRNEGNSSAHIYRLEEIPFEVKAYYRVEVEASSEVAPSTSAPSTSAPSTLAPPTLAPPTLAPALPSEPEHEPVVIETTGPVPVTNLEDLPTLPTIDSPEVFSSPEEFEVSNSLGGARRGLFGR
jgi:hypothetical protein